MSATVPAWVTAPNDHIPLGYTYDAKGWVLTFSDSYGFWYEYTYDANGRVLTYRDSFGPDPRIKPEYSCGGMPE